MLLINTRQQNKNSARHRNGSRNGGKKASRIVTRTIERPHWQFAACRIDRNGARSESLRDALPLSKKPWASWEKKRRGNKPFESTCRRVLWDPRAVLAIFADYGDRERANNIYWASQPLLIQERETFGRSAMRLSRRKEKPSAKGGNGTRVPGVVKIKRSWRPAKESAVRFLIVFSFSTFLGNRTANGAVEIF